MGTCFICSDNSDEGCEEQYSKWGGVGAVTLPQICDKEEEGAFFSWAGGGGASESVSDTQRVGGMVATSQPANAPSSRPQDRIRPNPM